MLHTVTGYIDLQALTVFVFLCPINMGMMFFGLCVRRLSVRPRPFVPLQCDTFFFVYVYLHKEAHIEHTVHILDILRQQKQLYT